MHRVVVPAVLALLVSLPPHARSAERWSDNLVLPSPQTTPAAPAPNHAPSSDPGYTQPWSEPVYTRQRTDAENQAIVDQMVERARRDAREGRGAGLDHYQGNSTPNVPDQVWQDHIARDRANEAFRRNEEDFYARQRYHNGN
jgi:hypothetical protein